MRQKTTEVTWETKTAGFNMPWTNALHHRLPPEPTASLHNADSPAKRLLRAEPNRLKSRSVNGHPARPKQARRKLPLLPAAEKSSSTHLVTANYTAVKLEAGRLMVERTIITPRGWVKRPRPDACMGKFILKLLILIITLAGTWYYGTRAPCKTN